MVVELYEALTKAGVDEETTKNVDKAALDTKILATKKDLAELKTDQEPNPIIFLLFSYQK